MEDYLLNELSLLHQSNIHSIAEVFLQLSIIKEIKRVYFLCESQIIRIINYSTLETITLIPFEDIKRIIIDSITGNFLIIEVNQTYQLTY